MLLQNLNIQGKRLFLLLCLLSCLHVKGQLFADFTTDTREGCAPLVVYSFTNLSTGNPVSYFWDFGNGITSIQQNPGAVYFVPGSYTVKLTITDDAGRKDSSIKKGYVTVNSPPVVNFAANNTSGCMPLNVQFSDKSNAVSGSITKWEWFFGDGGTVLQQSPSHIFTSSGTYSITLKATNSLGCTEVHTETDYIHVFELPKANFTSGSSASCNPPAAVNFSNTSTGGIITSTKWDFGDGVTSSSPNPSHTYTKAGTYQVKLIITNQNGCVDTIVKPTVIGSVHVGYTRPDTVCQGAPANFVNTSTPATAAALWDFGDNTNSTVISPTKKFLTAGSFMVKLVNDFGACKDSIVKSITVLPKPVADFSFVAPSVVCKLPSDVPFKANATSATSYLWDFGDGGKTTDLNPVHTYTNYGNYTVKLVVGGVNGCSDTAVKQNIISLVAAKARYFDKLPFKGCVPHDQAFSANISSPEPVTSYLWDFGDGGSSNLATPNYTYTTEGSYNVSLQIGTTNGCRDTLVMLNAVVITNKPKANFSVTPRISCASEKLQFTDLSTGSVDTRKWDFGDGTFSTIKNPLRNYSDTGYFTIRLIVTTLSACADTLTMPGYVYINPPVAAFNVRLNCDTPLTRHFINTSTSAKSNEWNFGDGSPISSDVNPVHTFATPGTYIVHLRVFNNDCHNDYEDTISVINEHPDFKVTQAALCRNNTLAFAAVNVNPKNIATYSWNFNDSTSIPIRTDSTINHNYLIAGTYNPSLTTTDILGCTQTVKHNVNVVVYGPKVSFTNPDGACVGTAVTFADQTKPTANNPLSLWVFNYGDGKSDTTTQPSFVHTYTAAGTYNLSLIVQDSYGCRDTLSRQGGINITNPKAAYFLNDSIFCNNSTANFINQSAGTGLSSFWNFGDGVTATVTNPSHKYLAEGSYSIFLSVKDRYGCTDSIEKVNAVVIGNAKAAFTLSDSIISCPPASVNFIDRSNYSTGVKWDFDDGNIVTSPNPSHIFLSPRMYHVKLVAYGHGACADSLVKDIIVKGPTGHFTYNSATSCAPYSVSFTATSTGGNNNITWAFGDGTITTTLASTTSHIYNVPGKYFPNILITDTVLNCTVPVFGKDTVTVTGAASFVKAHQSLFCDTASLQFFDSAVVRYDTVSSYQWIFGDGNYSNLRSPVHNYANAGIYPVSLVIKTLHGCTDTSSETFVKIVQSPQLQIVGPDAVCVAAPVLFSGNVQDTSAITWKWNFSNSSNYTISAPPPQSYNVAGNKTISATVTNTSGCIKTNTRVLTVHPLPNVDAGADSIICRGASITLLPSGADTYVWSNSGSLSCTDCANPVASPTDTMEYYKVTGTNSLTTCRKTDSVLVKVIQPFKLVGMTIDTICKGQSINISVTGADNYNWSPAKGLSNPNIANPVATPDVTTLYTVVGHDYRNCFSDVAYVPVAVYPIPVFNIIDDNVTIAIGNSITLQTTSSPDITNWQWFPTNGLSCSNCAEPVATPKNTIIYKATATNQGGCKATDQVTVTVFCNNGNLYMPNTFSPNNDGSNDVFYPRGKGISGVKSFQIFNRWGTLVFQKTNFSINDPASGWNGFFNGSPLPADVYIYQIEVICETGQIFPFRGDITLIR